nr:fructose-6-phosphate aldolase [Hymenobacter sp. BT559]
MRDEQFVLIAYFRADRPLKDLHRYGLEGQEVPLAAIISELEFGKLRKLEL